MSQPKIPSPKILVESAPPVTTIIINRPQVKNALDNEAARALAAALKAFESDAEARVAVLTGAGGAFCAGADLKELGSGTDYFPWAGSDEGPLRAPLAKPVSETLEPVPYVYCSLPWSWIELSQSIARRMPWHSTP